MTTCKHCQVSLEVLVLPSGESSRRQVCDACRPTSFKQRVESATATKREKFARQVVVCRHCFCPLMLLRLSNGKQETRRICTRCHEARTTDLTEAQKRKRAQVKAWKEANKERVALLTKAWKSAHKERVAEYPRKLLIEDVGLVRDAKQAHYSRRPTYPRGDRK